MTIAKPLLVSFSLLVFASASAFGNEATKNQSGASGGSASSSTSQQQSAKATGQMSAEQLIGKKVSDAQGKEIGEIKDVVVDLQNGRVHAAVLEFGGTLGVGEKNYAFPISQLKPGKSQGQYSMNIDKQKLENAEGFAQNEWPAMDSEYWGTVGGQGKAAAGATKARKMTLVRASEIQGKPVSDKSGQEVGEVQDLVIDMKSGQLRNIVIGVSDGGQAKVQPKALSAGMDDKLVLNMDAKQLRQQAQKPGGK
ncbi:MAG: PRC-barrel domain-containing protein [Burkholderiales bacterium]